MQMADPAEVITRALPMWDMGLAIGTITSLFAFIWFAFGRVLKQFETIAAVLGYTVVVETGGMKVEGDLKKLTRYVIA